MMGDVPLTGANLLKYGRFAYPSAPTVLGGFEYLLIPLGIIAVTFVVGGVVFTRQAPAVAERL
jgi:hypothetical protein